MSRLYLINGGRACGKSYLARAYANTIDPKAVVVDEGMPEEADKNLVKAGRFVTYDPDQRDELILNTLRGAESVILVGKACDIAVDLIDRMKPLVTEVKIKVHFQSDAARHALLTKTKPAA